MAAACMWPVTAGRRQKWLAAARARLIRWWQRRAGDGRQAAGGMYA